MKVSELRIGNWVQYKDSHKVEIDLSDFCEFYNTALFQKLKPIPLTEQWLLKFGWTWNEETNTYEKFPNGDARMHIHLNSLGGHTMFNYVLKATIANRIMHVHQLQNLYFALVGEELQITKTAQ